MPKFTVEISEIRESKVVVEAGSVKEALDLANQKYHDAEYVLSDESTVDMTLSCVSDRERIGRTRRYLFHAVFA